MTILIGIEKLDDRLIEEIQPIIGRNYLETGQFSTPLDIAWDMYKAAGNAFLVFVMRDEKILDVVGILCFLIAPYPHIKTMIMAQQATFYVLPDYRRFSLEMLKISEDYVKTIHDVDLIIQSARSGSNFCKVLKSKGYEEADVTFIKRLN